MQLRKMYYLLLILPLIIFNTACEDENTNEPVAINEAQVLVEYMEDNGDFINTAAPAMIVSSDVYANILASTDQVILDIRSAADFANGHIQGAVNVTTANILDYYETNNLDSKSVVVIACYSGQTAGWATGLLRLLGYDNVKDLKWGMSSWNSATSGSWVNSIGNSRSTSLVTTATAKAAVGNLPTLNTGKTTGADILRERVQTVLTEGFDGAKVTNSDVFTNSSNYYIVNYWSEDHYNWGHIPGAIQYTPGSSLKLDADLKTLPTDQTVAVYCYTGQTSAHVAAYLRVVGYDAKSIVYGVNGMSYDAMPGTKFVESSEVRDYALVTD
ncbi:MAG: hypothetical protein K9J12_15915 [Melioribacteraceae bacterium]|nr:hypothetical protein [Melioribacteraceae bacterium]